MQFLSLTDNHGEILKIPWKFRGKFVGNLGLFSESFREFWENLTNLLEIWLKFVIFCILSYAPLAAQRSKIAMYWDAS